MKSTGNSKAVIIVQARLGSTRLPAKIALDFGGVPMLVSLLKRLDNSEIGFRSVVATSLEKRDDLVEEFARGSGWNVHRGSESDVLSRFAGAYAEYGEDADTVIRICSDNPLLGFDDVNQVYARFCASEVDFLANANGPDVHEDGFAVEVFHSSCLIEANEKATEAYDRANLARISGLKSAFPNHLIGYSDHTLPEEMQTCMIAGMLGATIIEKHFTHDKTLPGNDHYHAMDKEDLKRFRSLWKKTGILLGSSDVTSHQEEDKSRKYARRSLVANCSIAMGEIVTEKMLTWKRPALGISPSEYGNLLGKEALVDIAEDTTLQWEMFQSN